VRLRGLPSARCAEVKGEMLTRAQHPTAGSWSISALDSEPERLMAGGQVSVAALERRRMGLS
jgi:hypothetical protein